MFFCWRGAAPSLRTSLCARSLQAVFSQGGKPPHSSLRFVICGGFAFMARSLFLLLKFSSASSPPTLPLSHFLFLLKSAGFVSSPVAPSYGRRSVLVEARKRSSRKFGAFVLASLSPRRRRASFAPCYASSLRGARLCARSFLAPMSRRHLLAGSQASSLCCGVLLAFTLSALHFS